MTAVRHNAARGRYELDTPHGLAIAVYHQQGDRLVFTHTEVPPAHEGRGVGTALIRFALASARSRGLKVVPVCPFVAAYMIKHPEEQDLLDAAHWTVLGPD